MSSVTTGVTNALATSSDTSVLGPAILVAGESSEAVWELIRLAWSSRAALAIAPLQDLLNLGAEGRMNQPGRAEGNWRWRCTEDMLSGTVFQRLGHLTKTANRLGAKESGQRSIQFFLEVTR